MSNLLEWMEWKENNARFQKRQLSKEEMDDHCTEVQRSRKGWNGHDRDLNLIWSGASTFSQQKTKQTGCCWLFWFSRSFVDWAVTRWIWNTQGNCTSRSQRMQKLEKSIFFRFQKLTQSVAKSWFSLVRWTVAPLLPPSRGCKKEGGEKGWEANLLPSSAFHQSLMQTQASGDA